MSGNCTSSSFSRLARKLMSSESSSQMCMFGSELFRRSKRAMLRAGGKCSERMELTDAAGDAFSDSFSAIVFFLTSHPGIKNHAPSLLLQASSHCHHPIFQTQLFVVQPLQGGKGSWILGLFTVQCVLLQGGIIEMN